MVPGALDDDRYRMVEDEFLAVAQRFTAHLHRAEYERLKALARRRHAATLSEIERPVVAGLAPTAATRRRRESAQRAGRDGAEGAAGVVEGDEGGGWVCVVAGWGVAEPAC
ncbi:hypothetical protein ESCO_002975 [Escovopsis weberi]|uniref:Uncharacterized protein n=1 Tax=Escovopsis weberi TaxID=150374 RepID=A0A0M8N264_ESCWE|nr:hypothetical protein ESCO_002975 [Escovopsis weberi]